VGRGAEAVLSVDALADELLAAINDYPAERPFSRDPARGEPERRLAAAYNQLYCELHDLAAGSAPPPTRGEAVLSARVAGPPRGAAVTD
jgi:hypothetical protein